jgi:transposase
MAAGWLRDATKGHACYDRKVAAGKTPMEARHCLRRRLGTKPFAIPASATP